LRHPPLFPLQLLSWALLAPPAHAGNGDGDGAWVAVAVTALLTAGVAFAVLWAWRRQRREAPGAQKSLSFADPARLAEEKSRLDDIAAQLVRVEHALRLGEDPDLRSLLDHATRAEAAARRLFSRVRYGNAGALGELSSQLDEAGRAAQQATERALSLHGDLAFAASGEPVGCFFCARPLANPDYRRLVSVQKGDSREEVLACPDCAARAGRGEIPAVLAAPDGRTHWSETPGYDPYARRHAEPGNVQEVAAWRFQPRRPLGEIGRLAAGGAAAAGLLGGAGAALAAATLLDLDAARESGVIHEAVKESAKRMTREPSASRFSDHS